MATKILKNSFNHTQTILVVACVLISYISVSASTAVISISEKIAKEKGLLSPKEISDWKLDPKDIPKDWIKIDNKFFSVFYPNCFTVMGEEGEDNPKLAGGIAFNRQKKCSSYIEQYADYNWLSIGISSVELKTIDKAWNVDSPLVRQKIKMNDFEAISLVGLANNYDVEKKQAEPQLRWLVYAICKKKTFEFGTMAPPGKPTLDLVEKNSYAFPEDFKKIISTFKCK